MTKQFEVREPLVSIDQRLNQCDSGTDSIVWMGEENAVHTTSLKMAPDNTLVIRVLIFKPGNQPSADQ